MAPPTKGVTTCLRLNPGHIPAGLCECGKLGTVQRENVVMFSHFFSPFFFFFVKVKLKYTHSSGLTLTVVSRGQHCAIQGLPELLEEEAEIKQNQKDFTD